MTDTICIYHGNCADGFGAAYAVWKRFGDNVVYYPATHGEPAPDVTGKQVIMVDFSYKLPVIKEMLNQCESMVILDHHKSAVAELEGFVDPKLTTVFDMDRSGAIITWEYFHADTPVPALLLYVQDRDLWQWKLPFSRSILMALELHPMQFDVWDRLSVNELATVGVHITSYYDSVIRDLVDRADIMQLDGYTVPVINAPHHFASDLGNILAKGYPFAVVFSVDARGIRYSLRSADDGIDVSEIARSHGGGGHFHAAGFETETPIHTSV